MKTTRLENQNHPKPSGTWKAQVLANPGLFRPAPSHPEPTWAETTSIPLLEINLTLASHVPLPLWWCISLQENSMALVNQALSTSTGQPASLHWFAKSQAAWVCSPAWTAHPASADFDMYIIKCTIIYTYIHITYIIYECIRSFTYTHFAQRLGSTCSALTVQSKPPFCWLHSK